MPLDQVTCPWVLIMDAGSFVYYYIPLGLKFQIGNFFPLFVFLCNIAVHTTKNVFFVKYFEELKDSLA